MIAGQLALMIATAFASAAFYINFAEHPARMLLPVQMAVRQWAPSYKRGFTMQSSLAVLGGACALGQWYLDGGVLWLVGALVLLTNWPYTLMVIMPTNHRLLASDSLAEAEVSQLLQRWNRLHGLRTVLGGLSAAVLLSASMR
jgi:hypothetical protein